MHQSCPISIKAFHHSEARWGLQPRRLRFMFATMPAKLQNVTDGITNPVRLHSKRTVHSDNSCINMVRFAPC